LTIISKHWNLIRVYGADRDTRRILRLIKNNNLPLKVIQGIWLFPEEDDPGQRTANVTQVLLGIELAITYSKIVIALSVGNETQVFWSGHKMNPDNLIRYIRAVRHNVSVPVSTADDYLYWNKSESRILVDETDFVFSHIHPLWNGQTLDNAINWIDTIYHELQETHPDRVIVLGETGWATDYDASKNGPGEQGALIKGEVGLEAQASFLIQVHRWIEFNQVTTFLFEAFDESWKGGGEDSPPNEVEKHWGVYKEDRTPKKSFLEFLDSLRNTTD
jgi:exo-beta-1,3-glucanase (GH17 family)